LSTRQNLPIALANLLEPHNLLVVNAQGL
jgi:hypothetical protein